MMRLRNSILLAALVGLSACAGYEKGEDVGLGFNVLDTQSQEDKENEKWFRSFYGECQNPSAAGCKAE